MPAHSQQQIWLWRKKFHHILSLLISTYYSRTCGMWVSSQPHHNATEIIIFFSFAVAVSFSISFCFCSTAIDTHTHTENYCALVLKMCKTFVSVNETIMIFVLNEMFDENERVGKYIERNMWVWMGGARKAMPMNGGMRNGVNRQKA